jgi:hypothetical protein
MQIIPFQYRGHLAVLASCEAWSKWIALVYERAGSVHLRRLTGIAASEDQARAQAVEALRAVRKIDDVSYLHCTTRTERNIHAVGLVAGGDKRWVAEVLRLRPEDDTIDSFFSAERRSAHLAKAVVADEMRRVLLAPVPYVYPFAFNREPVPVS